MNTSAVIWLTFTIIGFCLWWPIGAALLLAVFATAMTQQFSAGLRWPRPGTGNLAFDEYREQTLRQLEEDRIAFGEFVNQLRLAKDRREFDRFMAQRRRIN